MAVKPKTVTPLTLVSTRAYRKRALQLLSPAEQRRASPRRGSRGTGRRTSSSSRAAHFWGVFLDSMVTGKIQSRGSGLYGLSKHKGFLGVLRGSFRVFSKCLS